MPIGTALAIGLTAASVGGSLGGAALGASAAGHAADAQSQAAEYAAQLQHQDAEAALAFEKQQYATQQQQLAPYIQQGQQAITNLGGLVENGGFPDFTEQFAPPTNVTEQNDPGYQFRLAQGQQALQRSSSASGNLLSGGELKAEQQFGQDYASNEYNNVYNRALQQYQQKYNIFENNQNNRYNRLAGLAGIGQIGTGQSINAGNAAGSTISNILLGSGQQIGNDLNNAAAARASGYVGAATAYGSALGGIGNSLTNYVLLSNLLGGGGFNPSIADTAALSQPIPDSALTGIIQ